MQRYSYLRDQIGDKLVRGVHRGLEEVDDHRVETVTQLREAPECLLGWSSVNRALTNCEKNYNSGEQLREYAC